ncbi:MAG: prepilin-type N-terminal cleavage/methylation domain-containing protein [Phycisphaerales bacterium]|nr:prepilin-type N-terminal cleavage/methylation domain-containing protein [Phycisphaerales bacterium]
MNKKTNIQKQHHSLRQAAKTLRGFTLVEVLVVVVIGVILLTISVPAFQTLIASSERSLAVNSLQSAIQAAQDIALDGREGEDGAIIFLIDDNGRLTLAPAVKIGSYREPFSAEPGQLGQTSFDYDYIEMEVFAPLDSGDLIQLPESWFVRGYAPIGSMVDRLVTDDVNQDRTAAIWYNSPIYGGTDVDHPAKTEGHWVFPETNLFAKDAQHVGGDTNSGDLGGLQGNFRSPRQSFMIRFDGRTGQLSRTTKPAVFIDPRSSRERPFGDQPMIEDRWKRVDLADSVQNWGIRMLSASDTNSDGTHWTLNDQYTRALWLGNISHDTVLVKAVTRLALYNEADLAADLGARGLNRATGSLYAAYPQDDSESEIQYDLDLWSAGDRPSEDELRDWISQWIEGDTSGPGGRPDGQIVYDTDPANAEEIDTPLSRLYLIQPYSGELQEVLR